MGGRRSVWIAVKGVVRLLVRSADGGKSVDYERYQLSAREWILAFLKGALLGAAVAYTFYRSVFAWSIVLAAGGSFPFYEKKRLQRKRQDRLAREFQESAIVLAAALSAGYSIENAFAVSTRELELLYGRDGLMLQEMKRMEAQIHNNHSVEQILMAFAQRSGVEDIRNFAQVFAAAKRSGGSLAEILRNTAEILREKGRMKEEIRTLTAAKQYEQRIMNGLPFLIVWYMNLTSPGFFDLMYQTMLGKAVMSVCLVVYLTAFYIAERILDVPF